MVNRRLRGMNMRRDSLDFMEKPVAGMDDLSSTKSPNPPHPQFHRLNRCRTQSYFHLQPAQMYTDRISDRPYGEHVRHNRHPFCNLPDSETLA
jgi:hypothetical protein